MNPKDVVSYIEGELFISVVPVGKTVMVSSAGEAAVSGVSLVDTVFQLGISYIIAGKDSLDYEQALTKLKEQFGIETLMLGGGAAEKIAAAIGAGLAEIETVKPYTGSYDRFLHSEDLSEKSVYPFATNGGWIGHTFKDFENACPASRVHAGLNVRFNEKNSLLLMTKFKSGRNRL